MGFKFKRLNLTGGSSDFPVGDTDELRRSRSETVLQKIVEKIIASDCGWILDPNRNENITDFSDCPCMSGSLAYPSLFLRNTISGCKMFIAYFGNKTYEAAHVIKDFDAGTSRSSLYQFGTTPTVMGLLVSIIPEGSTSEFGQSFDADFLPSDATRIIGTSFWHETTSIYYRTTYAGNPENGKVYCWGILLNQYTISVMTGFWSSGIPGLLGVPIFASGKIIGTIAHGEDTTPQAKYGTLIFRKGRVDQSYPMSPENGPVLYSSFAVAPSATLNMVGLSAGSSSFANYYSSFAAITNASGEWINGTDESTHGVGIYPVGFDQLSSYIFDATGGNKSRWIPFAVASGSTNLSTHGVVSGDGFKGYLDTTLFRCGIGADGTQFDNGNFICADAQYNLLLGWDPANTDSLAGE